MQDIFETIEDQGTTYDNVVTKLKISYERHVFHKSKQSADETIDNYIVRLSKLAISCEFMDKNEMIRDQVVNSCGSTKLRKKLLEEETLTLDKVKTIARTYCLGSALEGLYVYL